MADKSVKQHLVEFHKTAAAHHTQSAINHGVMSKCFSKLADASKDWSGDGDESKHLEKIADQAQNQSDSHTEMAKYHTKCCKALGDERAEKTVTATATKRVDTTGLGSLAHFVEATPEG